MAVRSGEMVKHLNIKQSLSFELKWFKLSNRSLWRGGAVGDVGGGGAH